MGTLTKIVIPTLDSRYKSVDEYLNAEVYIGKIEKETEPPVPPKCFLGAWYRKVLSSKDYWLGIEGVITLPEFIPDEKRFLEDKRIKMVRNLDNPSIYMGGSALSESDAGLSLGISYFDNNFEKELDASSEKLAFQPFYRYIYQEVIEENRNVKRTNVNSWNMADVRNVENYYFPGDKIKMMVVSPVKDYLQLVIKVIEPTKIPKYLEIRKKYNLKDDRPSDYYSPMFYSEGHGIEKAEFKRVNSIDQFGNEGIVVSNTDAMIIDATWHEVYLFRQIDGKLKKVPFNLDRQSDMACPNKESFTIIRNHDEKNLGGEKINIHPKPFRKE